MADPARTSIAKPNQNQVRRSFSTKMRVGLNRLRGISAACPLPVTGVNLGSFCRESIGASALLSLRPKRLAGVKLEGLVVIADGGGQLALLRLAKPGLLGVRLNDQNGDGAACHHDDGGDQHEFEFHWLVS